MSSSYDSMHQVRYDIVPAKNTGNRAMYSRPKQEFVADFEIIARRIFGASSKEYQIFQLYFVAGYDWKICARAVGIDRGNFFHMVYKVEECLGRAYFEVRPYPLYPTDDYFGVRSSNPVEVNADGKGRPGERNGRIPRSFGPLLLS
jgi:hypothetical protein